MEKESFRVGCSRYTGKVTDDKHRPVEVKANAKRSILAILGGHDKLVFKLVKNNLVTPSVCDVSVSYAVS